MWTYDTAKGGTRAQFHGDAIVAAGSLVVPSDAAPSAFVYAFDADTGKVRWRMEFEGGVATTPLAAGNAVIVASATGKVARIDAASGKAVWSVAPDGARPVLPYIQSPASDGRRVYFASNSPKLFALDAPNGTVVWRKDFPARINTSLQVHGGTLYAGTADGHLYALDPASGEVRRRISLGGMPYGTLVVTPPLLVTLVAAKPAKVVALDLSTYTTRWERTTPREWTTMQPLVHDGTVIAGNEEKELCAFALDSGETRWCTPVPQVPRGLGTSGGMLYVGTLNGRILAYRLPE